jgi:TonB-linked SusC/RagA family outer membrane protein
VLEQVPDPDYPNATGIRLAAPAGEIVGNPYSNLNNGGFDQYTDSKLFTDLLLNQKLDFILKGLTLNGKVSLSTYYQNESLYSGFAFPEYQLAFNKIGTGANPWYRTNEGNEVYTLPLFNVNVGGLQSNFYNDLYYEMALNYKVTLGKHNLTALALMNRQQKNAGTNFPYFNEGLVGRVTYDYSKKYLIELNVGYTGSERFAPSNRFGFFPSGAVGWVISEEDFFKSSVPWVSKLKLRYSDGLVGSDYAQNRWLYVNTYTIDNVGYIEEGPAPNVTAQWEEAHKRDLGLELGIFKNTLTLSIDLFDEQRSKMLLTPRTVTMLVANTFKDLNLGRLKKHGIEVEAEFNKLVNKNLNYFIKGIFGFSENRVLFEDDLPYAPEYSKAAGKPLDAQLKGVVLTGNGYYTSIDDMHISPSPIDVTKANVGDYKFLDYNVDGVINSLDKYPIKGTYYAPITYSLSGGLSFKGFDFNFLFEGNKGKYVAFSQNWEIEFDTGQWRLHTSQLDYWTPVNTDAGHATLHYQGNSGQLNLAWGGWGGGGQSIGGYDIALQDRLWRNADYLRLKEVYLGYTINSTYLKQLAGISNLNIYITGNNLLTLTPLIEGDPERKTFYQADFYPVMANIKFGVKFSF